MKTASASARLFRTGLLEMALVMGMAGGSAAERLFPRERSDHGAKYSQAILNCQQAARQRIGVQGFDRVTFGDARVDLDLGERVLGNLEAEGLDGSHPYRFSCVVNLKTGEARVISVSRRHVWTEF